MSVDLMCKLVTPVRLLDLEATAGGVLADMLGLMNGRSIIGRSRHGSGRDSLSSGVAGNDQFLFSIEGEPEVVAVGIIEPEEGETIVYFNVSARRSPVEYALAAALAIATARLLGEDVTDDALFYTKELTRRPDELLARICRAIGDLRLAAGCLL